MKPALLFGVFGAFLSCAANAATIDQSTIVVDQGFGIAGSGVVSRPTIVTKRAQSVTIGLTGTLAQIDLQVGQQGGTGNLRIELYDGVAWLPGAVSFATTSVPRGMIPATMSASLLSLDFGYLNHPVTAGQQFSIVVYAEQPASGSNGFLWSIGAFTDAEMVDVAQIDYAGGEVRTTTNNGLTWSLNGADRGFRTWVEVATVPEPASWGLMIAGFGMTGVAMRRRPRRVVA